MIEIIPEKLPVPPTTGNDTLLDSGGKMWIQYFVSDPDLNVGDRIQGTMTVTLIASNTTGFVYLGFPDDSGGMVGAQAVLYI